MIKTILSIFLFFTIVDAQTINVAVAANVNYAMKSLVKEFHKNHPNISVKTTLASSGKLVAQISNGAPYHLFLSANMKYPQTLYKNGNALNSPIIYAYGSIAYFSTKRQNFQDIAALLTSKKIQRIAIAMPQTAPYGAAALEAFKNGGFYKQIHNKLIYGESISQTLSYVLQAADLGVVAKSSLMSPKLSRFKQGVNWVDVAPSLYTPIAQGIVILQKGKGNKAVEDFYNFILSDAGKKILEKFGYIVP